MSDCKHMDLDSPPLCCALVPPDYASCFLAVFADIVIK